MEASNDPIEVFLAEQNRIELFYSFWDRRIDVESHYIAALQGLMFEVPGPAGSLKDALDALNALVRIEIDQRTTTLNVLRDLRGDQKDVPSPVEGLEYTSRTRWLTLAVNDLRKRIADLAERKVELTHQETVTEKTTLRADEVVQQRIDNPSTLTRLLLRKHKNQPPPQVDPFTQFDQADRQYRNSVVYYNELRSHYYQESMKQAEKMVTDDFKAIATTQKMIKSYAESQSDLIGALNQGSSHCQLIASNISPSTESNNFVARVQNSIRTEFRQRHLYQNFWFGPGDNGQLPTILFGRQIPTSGPKAEAMTNLFTGLIHFTPSPFIQRPFPIHFTQYTRSEQLSKLVHDIETHWNPETNNSGMELKPWVVTESESKELLLHFLDRMPEPLVDLRDHPGIHLLPLKDRLQLICTKCNDALNSLSGRKMLYEMLQYLRKCNDNTLMGWAWWDLPRSKLWGKALTHTTQDNIRWLLALWVYCYGYLAQTGKFVVLPESLAQVRQGWEESVYCRQGWL